MIIMSLRRDYKKQKHILFFYYDLISRLFKLLLHDSTIINIRSLNPCPAETGYILFCKQCRSRSVGFWRSQLIWICTVCHQVCKFITKIWIKLSDWLKIRSGCGFLIYSAGQGLRDNEVLKVSWLHHWFRSQMKGSACLNPQPTLTPATKRGKIVNCGSIDLFILGSVSL